MEHKLDTKNYLNCKPDQMFVIHLGSVVVVLHDESVEHVISFDLQELDELELQSGLKMVTLVGGQVGTPDELGLEVQGGLETVILVCGVLEEPLELELELELELDELELGLK